ncbi:unnamed protein product [Clonostachys rosea]|uniref:GS catalytic domain-containing protein n=1 Tax=Bionectria ochroleuca TaxID=29856 RepID=A0ABY6ULA5_BIOOC|nr:unnamed protein product [Clonostachys rosea]
MDKILPGEDDLKQFLQKYPSVKYIRLQWIDFSGVLRTRFLPSERCLKIARGEEEYLLPQVSMIIPVSTAPKCFPTTDTLETWVLEPDWSSLRCCGFRQHHASVMCFVRHKEAQEPYDKCPRMLLCRTLARLERDWGVKALAGFEIEFMLLEGRNAQPLDQLDRLNSYQTTAGLRGQTLDTLEEVLDDLEKASIGIQHFHTETHDQIEIALSPESPLQAIDSLILAQETIRTVFVRHGIKATMTPKPLIKGPTNGIHLHLSVDKLALPHTDNFLAGILNHMSSLCAFGMANFDGYVRTGKDAAGAWIGFGTENRDLPVRKVNDQHWEFRMLDSTSNPYLFTAAVLLAGLGGIDEKAELTWEDCGVFPHSLDEGQRTKYQLTKKMPGDLKNAVDSLKEDTAMRQWVGVDLCHSYIPLKDKEIEVFQEMTEEERRIRFTEYF